MNKERKDYTTDLAVLLDQGRDLFEKYQDRPGFGIVISVSDGEGDAILMISKTFDGIKNSFDAIKDTPVYRKYKWKTLKDKCRRRDDCGA